MGGDRAGASLFQGELDELRITALPTALVEDTGWGFGASNANVQEWEWYDDPGWDPAGVGWLRMRLKPGANFEMVADTPLQPAGGYFVAPDSQIYSYQSYDQTTGEISGIEPVSDDLLCYVPFGQYAALSARGLRHGRHRDAHCG